MAGRAPTGRAAPFFRRAAPRPASASSSSRQLPGAAGVPRGAEGGRPSSAGGASAPSFAQDAAEVGAPNCKCGEPAVRRTVKKEGANKGKEFFVCRKPQGLQCGFFDWAEPSPLNGVPSGAPKRRQEVLRGEEVGPAVHAHPHVSKRPRFSPRSQIALDLEDTEGVSFKLHASSPEELRTAVRNFEGAKITKTSFLGVEKVVVPIDSIVALERHVEANAGTKVTHNVPQALVARIIEYRRAEKAREEQGDVVTRPLDEILPALMCEKLMDFQWHGIHFALKRGGRCLIGDDMGLGKTLQAIAVARVYMSDWPLLIVCPSSLRLNWKEELLRWLEGDLREVDIHVIMNGKDINKPLALVNIVSYDLMRKVPPNFVRRCRFIIADESHYLKSTTAKRSQVLTPLIKNAKRALLLSGTPALSRPVELFPQVNAISPILFPRYQEYVERYCAAHVGRFGYDVSGASNLDELHTLLRGSLLIRRKKEEVLTQLPEKQRQVLWVQTKPTIMKDVAKASARLEALRASVQRATSDARAAALQNEVKAAQTEFYSLTGMAKLESVMEFCKDTAETGCKFIVFVHHNEVMEGLDTYITTKLKLGIIRIDGGTPQGSRQMLCRKFQEDAKCRVALLSITAAGVGLTLTRASVVLFAELYWNPGSLLQAEDRAHRIGQRDCVLVKYLLARQTIDESMWSTVRRKLTVVGHSLTGTAARMDVTENGRPNGPSRGSISSFFKPKRKSTQVKNGSVEPDDEVIEIEDDNTQTPHSTNGPRTPDGSQELPQRRTASAEQDILFPTSLSDIEASYGMSVVTGRPPEGNNRTDSADMAAHELNGAQIEAGDLAMARKLQEQMDADIALARKLQAQFDAEDHG